MTDHTRGTISLVSAAFFWSLGGLLIKSITLGPLAIAGLRSVVAALVIWAYARTRRLHLTRDLLLGATAYAGTVLFFVLSTKNTTAANAILLQYTAPAWVALFSSRMLTEPITRLDWLTIILVFIGCGVFFLDQLSTEGMLGNIFAIVSGIFFAFCVIMLRRGHSNSEQASIEMVLLGNVIAALFVLVGGAFAPVLGLPPLIDGPISLQDIALLLVLGVVQLGLGYIFFVRGVRHVTAIEAALIPVLEPILNPLWVAIFRGEFPSLVALLGGVIVVGAVTARGLVDARKKRGLRVES